MRLVKKHALEDNCWAGDGPKHWNHVKTSKLWDKIKGTFQHNYYTIQRTGRQTSRKKQKNRNNTTSWATVYNNCSAAGHLKKDT